VSVKSDSEINAINHYRHLISKLSNTDKIDLGIKIEKPSNSAIAVCRIAEIYIPLGELVDKKEEILKLNKRLSELDKLIVSIEAKLSNKQFIDKAPEKVVDGEKNKLNDFIIEREKILSNIEVLK
jgi:valyl-tRNA synthetase